MANPAFNEKTLQKLGAQEGIADVMTASGAINKTGILFVLLVISAAFGWQSAETGIGAGLLLISFLVAFVLSLVIIFKKDSAPFLAPVYAVAEGFGIGAMSAWASAAAPGVVSNAIALTFVVLFGMLLLYRFRILQATPAFVKMVVVSTAALAVVYLCDLMAGLFLGTRIPMIHESGRVGILFSLFAVGIASMNFIVDFDLIEKAAAQKAPKYFEWYAAFSLMLTLVWLYLEILRLLGKMSKK